MRYGLISVIIRTIIDNVCFPCRSHTSKRCGSRYPKFSSCPTAHRTTTPAASSKGLNTITTIKLARPLVGSTMVVAPVLTTPPMTSHAITSRTRAVGTRSTTTSKRGRSRSYGLTWLLSRIMARSLDLGQSTEARTLVWVCMAWYITMIYERSFFLKIFYNRKEIAPLVFWNVLVRNGTGLAVCAGPSIPLLT